MLGSIDENEKNLLGKKLEDEKGGSLQKKFFLYVGSAVHFALYLTSLSSMMLIRAAVYFAYFEF